MVHWCLTGLHVSKQMTIADFSGRSLTEIERKLIWPSKTEIPLNHLCCFLQARTSYFPPKPKTPRYHSDNTHQTYHQHTRASRNTENNTQKGKTNITTLTITRTHRKKENILTMKPSTQTTMTAIAATLPRLLMQRPWINWMSWLREKRPNHRLAGRSLLRQLGNQLFVCLFDFRF